jgi:phosphatidylinositol glycan class S
VATELVKTVLTDIFQQKHQRLLSYAFRTNQNDGMKQVVKHASRYKVILSLMNEDPTTLALDWDIYTAVQSYLQPFLSAVSPVFNVSLATQIQYFTKPALVMEPHPVTNESYYLWNTLPNFINSEWNLASVTEKHPILNFCVFVPALKHQPLSLYLDYEQRMQEPLAYLVSQWGGVTFLNTPSMQGYQTLSTDTLRPVMATILTQMRTLFGIQPLHSTLDNVQIDVAPHSGITRWELDSLLRMYTTRALVNTVNTLQSLSRMVQNLQHMVIQDHIDNKIQSSIHLVQEAQRHLEQGDYVQAMHVSAQAHILAEEAFFDPTMVGMLYFPDEHKYAVYMPLFIPIAVPLIMALLREFRLKQKIKTD